MTDETEDLEDPITHNLSFYDLTKDVVEKIDAVEEIQLTPEQLEKIRIAVWVSAKTAKELIERIVPPAIIDGKADLAALTALRDEIAYVIGNAMRSQVLWENHQNKSWQAVHLVVRYLAAIHIHRSANGLLGIYDEDIDHNYKRIDEDIRALLAGDWKRLIIKPFEQEADV